MPPVELERGGREAAVGGGGGCILGGMDTAGFLFGCCCLLLESSSLSFLVKDKYFQFEIERRGSIYRIRKGTIASRREKRGREGRSARM